MKVTGKPGELQQDVGQIDRSARERKGIVDRVKTNLGQLIQRDDEVKMSGVGALLNEQLNPQTLSAERKKKLEEIKELLALGKYNPPMEKVAEALSNEISLEILTRGGFAEGEEE